MRYLAVGVDDDSEGEDEAVGTVGTVGIELEEEEGEMVPTRGLVEAELEAELGLEVEAGEGERDVA